ncbi:MAG TPA: ribosome recycling factor [Candidatus Omnitrophota bacterium]|nr:ribosome recycling factor [Candidatus Omnitrophota bacterium]HPS20681.1 ribosome recycling factor [Candidatus Omnitrophota bacterium]
MSTEVEKLVKESETKMQAAVSSITQQFSTIRTGRAHPSLVENIKVDYYGTKSTIKQLANITVPEARLIVLHPWDKGALDAIDKAIQTSDVGLTPQNDGKVLRLTMPQLTQERRDELKKVLHKISEDGRVSIRNTRHAANEKSAKLEKDKLFTEDDKFAAKDRVQKLTDKYIGQIDEALKIKETEISQ